MVFSSILVIIIGSIQITFSVSNAIPINSYLKLDLDIKSKLHLKNKDSLGFEGMVSILTILDAFKTNENELLIK